MEHAVQFDIQRCCSNVYPVPQDIIFPGFVSRWWSSPCHTERCRCTAYERLKRFLELNLMRLSFDELCRRRPLSISSKTSLLGDLRRISLLPLFYFVNMR